MPISSIKNQMPCSEGVPLPVLERKKPAQNMLEATVLWRRQLLNSCSERQKAVKATYYESLSIIFHQDGRRLSWPLL